MSAPAAADRQALFEALLAAEGLAPAATGPRPGSGGERAPLSLAQERLWFLHRLDPESAAYNIPLALRLKGTLDRDALARALGEITRRHHALRTVFEEHDGEARQVVRAWAPIELRVDEGAEIRAWVAAQAGEPFDLRRELPFRAALLRVADDEHILAATLHHIVGDAWSAGVLLRELAALYDAFARGLPSPLPELPIQYADFAVWQRERLDGDAAGPLVEYWRTRLSGAPPLLRLPADRPRAEVQGREGGIVTRVLPPELTARLHLLARECGATVYAVLLAGFKALLARHGAGDDVVVGTPVAGRDDPAVEGLIGFFINTLALRTALGGDPPFRELVRRVRDTTLGAFAHQELPFERLVDALQVERTLSFAPVFQVAFALQNTPRGAFHLPGLEASSLAAEAHHAKFDLFLSATEAGGALRLALEYSSELFDESTAERLLARYAAILEQAAADAARPLSALDVLAPGERARLDAWSRGALVSAQRGSLHGLIAEQAASTPHAIALIDPNGALTYAELEARANRLAHLLRERGVGGESPVAVLLERGNELVTALLAILKAGGVYVPLEPEHPDERLRFTLDDSGAALLLTDAAHADRLPGASVLLLDREAEALARQPQVAPEDRTRAGSLAYVIYTSGSTGRPKGVMVPHDGVANVVRAQRHLAPRRPGRLLQAASTAFDASVFEMVMALAHGHALAIAPAAARAGDALADFMEDTGVTGATLPPSVLRTLPERDLPALRTLCVAGEACTPELAARWAPGRRFWNLYGPTEGSIWATAARVRPGAVSIGRPIAGTAAYVLDAALRPVPAGAWGELHLGGIGVARGYLGRAALTAERFVPDPFSDQPGARLYRTGDRARWRANGVLEYGGRVDEQVKLRGHRIEPGEIEAALLAHPSVAEAAVVAREDAPGQTRLVAYVAPRVPADVLREHLRERLPAYMVPAAFVALDRLPLTSSGKLDRRALPAPEAPAAGEGAAPETPTETALAAIWAEALGVERVGTGDNFFELGGDSILGLRIVDRASRAGLPLTPRDLFQHQTVAHLAAHLDARTATTVEHAPAPDTAPLTPVQRWFFTTERSRPSHFNQTLLLDYHGPALAPEEWRRVIRALMEHHPALRLRFTRADGEWSQRVAPAGDAPYEHVELSALAPGERSDAVARHAAATQQSLDIQHGPLLRVVTYDVGEATRILLAAHHLAVDGVSWRVLLDDLAALCEQSSRGEPLALPPATSFLAWADRLGHALDDAALREAREYWKAESAAWTADPLPLDLPGDPADNTAGSADTVVRWIGEEVTAGLTRGGQRAYRASVEEALLAVLGTVLTRWTGRPEVLVEIESHGREPEAVGVDLDLSRSVGWFTAMAPVRLGGADAVATAKEHARAARRFALAYGVLRYAGALGEAPRPPVVFNYLGRFDRSLGEGSAFRPAPEPAGAWRGPADAREHLLEVGITQLAGRLQLRLTFSAALHTREAMDRLARDFVDEAEALSARFAAATAPRLGPSDFPLAALTPGELDELGARFGEIEDVYPLAPLQSGMVYHHLMEGADAPYVVQVYAEARGDAPRLRRAWEEVMLRHPALRTVIAWEGLHAPLQIVLPGPALEWREEDLRALAPEERTRHIRGYMRDDRARGFDIARPPLLRLALFRTGEDAWGVLWTYHHLLLDGWSHAQVLAEVRRAYDGVAQPAPARPFRDYVAWLARQDAAAAERFWRDALRGVDGPTPLHFPAPDADAPDTAAEAVRWLTPELTRALEAGARAHKVTPATLFQGAWALLLARYADGGDVLFGTVEAGRPSALAGAERMVGPFINTLATRVRVDEGARTGAWLQALQAEQAEARRFGYAPLSSVQRWAGMPGGTPLFETLIAFENYPAGASAPGAAGEGLHLRALEAVERTGYPLNVTVAPGRGGAPWKLRAIYSRRRFGAAGMERLLAELEGVLEQLAGPDLPVSRVEILSHDERQQVVVDWNRTAADFPRDRCVHELFAEQARRTPYALALESDAGIVTYAELDERANRLAHLLCARGVGVETRVGVLLERGPELVVALLAVLKAGGAYVPLDADYPAERLAFMLRDSGAALLLTRASLAARVPEPPCAVMRVDDPAVEPAASAPGASAPGVPATGASAPGVPATGAFAPGASTPASAPGATAPAASAPGGEPPGWNDGKPDKSGSYADDAVREGGLRAPAAVSTAGDGPRDGPRDGRAAGTTTPQNLAYVVYTSGSTGTPKGVMISHEGLAALCAWHARAFEVGPDARATLVASVGFDASVWELWPYLLAGASIRAVPPALRVEPEALGRWMEAERVTHAFLPTPLAEALLSEGSAGPSAWLLTGGDRLRRAPGAGFGFRMSNNYGPTESTVVATSVEIAPGEAGDPPIGRPIDNTRGYVLDAALRPVPVGAWGELHLGGAQLARGYLGRPALTAERFIPDPFAEHPGARLYRTGDRVRWRADGVLEYGGRVDAQVKLRGYRIEPGEIEAALVAHPEVAEAAVVAREEEPGEARLVAYVVTRADAGALRKHLKERLPAYMVPAAFVMLDRLPLTPNGKVDRRALPAPEYARPAESHTAPRDETEDRIARLWAEVLGVERVGVEDNFFDLGGDSLLLVRVSSRIRAELGKDLPMVELFRHPTVAALAGYVNGEAAAATADEGRDRGSRRRAAARRRDR